MSDIKDRIVKAKPAAPSKFIVMGDPMTGKTTLAAKAPKPLYISTDGNAAKMGLDAINADSLQTVREAIDFFATSDDYKTLVIDTVEGIADLFETTTITNHQAETGTLVKSLNDVPYGKLTGQYNRSIAAFAETLASIPKNVLVLSYTKRRVDDLTGNMVLDSELKNIRQFTRFADGIILTSYDGEKHHSSVVHKRSVMAGEVAYGDIEPFLRAAGWELPKKKTKVGTTKKG